MGGIIRCIRNDYNLDQLENTINKTDPESGFDEILKIIKQHYNAYIDIDDKKMIENNHYIDNFLEKKDDKRSNTFSLNQRALTKYKKKYN